MVLKIGMKLVLIVAEVVVMLVQLLTKKLVMMEL